MHRSLTGVLAVVLLSGCPHKMGADRVERHGWHRVHAGGEETTYDERFERIAYRLEEVGCDEIAKGEGDPKKPIIVLLHGAGGEGVEMKKAVPLLADSKPAMFWVLRWSPWDRREALVTQLAAGLSRLAECVPGGAGRIVVLGHSAGGVLASLAVGRVVPPKHAPDDWLTVVTIAAPLSGHVRGTDHGPEPAFIFDLANQPDYPAAAPGVRVLHLRTSLPGDVQMTPFVGHVPNDIRVGVPGAPQIDLPGELSHAGALVYVSYLFADGSFPSWLEPRRADEAQQAKKSSGTSGGATGIPKRSGRRGARESMRPMTDLFQW